MKITFKDLSLPLKVAVALVYIWTGLWSILMLLYILIGIMMT